MASNYTENFGLCQWEATDQVLRTEFNEDNRKVDAVLVKHETALSENAQAINIEANARTSAVASLTAELATRGNCKIYSTSYAGDGTTSHSHTFPSQPLIVFISGPSFQLIALRGNPDAFTMEGDNYWGADLTWNNCTLTVTYRGTLGGGDYKIGNKNGTVYYMIALMGAEE